MLIDNKFKPDFLCLFQSVFATKTQDSAKEKKKQKKKQNKKHQTSKKQITKREIVVFSKQHLTLRLCCQVGSGCGICCANSCCHSCCTRYDGGRCDIDA